MFLPMDVAYQSPLMSFFPDGMLVSFVGVGREVWHVLQLPNSDGYGREGPRGADRIRRH